MLHDSGRSPRGPATRKPALLPLMIFTNCGHCTDNLTPIFVQNPRQILAGGEAVCSPLKDRKLQAFRHRGGMGKKGARTAGGASVLLLPGRALPFAAAPCFPGLVLASRSTVTISNIIGNGGISLLLLFNAVRTTKDQVRFCSPKACCAHEMSFLRI